MTKQTQREEDPRRQFLAELVAPVNTEQSSLSQFGRDAVTSTNVNNGFGELWSQGAPESTGRIPKYLPQTSQRLGEGPAAQDPGYSSLSPFGMDAVRASGYNSNFGDFWKPTPLPEPVEEAVAAPEESTAGDTESAPQEGGGGNPWDSQDYVNSLGEHITHEEAAAFRTLEDLSGRTLTHPDGTIDHQSVRNLDITDKMAEDFARQHNLEQGAAKTALTALVGGLIKGAEFGALATPVAAATLLSTLFSAFFSPDPTEEEKAEAKSAIAAARTAATGRQGQDMTRTFGDTEALERTPGLTYVDAAGAKNEQDQQDDSDRAQQGGAIYHSNGVVSYPADIPSEDSLGEAKAINPPPERGPLATSRPRTEPSGDYGGRSSGSSDNDSDNADSDPSSGDNDGSDSKGDGSGTYKQSPRALLSEPTDFRIWQVQSGKLTRIGKLFLRGDSNG